MLARFFFFSLVSNRRIVGVNFFLFLLPSFRFFFSFLVMSNPSRSQQRFPFRTPVRVNRNFRKLAPITQTIRPIEQKNEPTQSSSLSITNVDVECETPTIDAKDFWTKLREHFNKERLKLYDQHGNQQTPNKVVRIFVSSTFTDFFNEREVLIKKVFPALRDDMESSGIQIIDCDLRWGVSKIK